MSSYDFRTGDGSVERDFNLVTAQIATKARNENAEMRRSLEELAARIDKMQEQINAIVDLLDAENDLFLDVPVPFLPAQFIGEAV